MDPSENSQGKYDGDQTIHQEAIVADLHAHPGLKVALGLTLHPENILNEDNAVFVPEIPVIGIRDVGPVRFLFEGVFGLEAYDFDPFTVRTDFPKLKKGGVDLLFSTLYVPEQESLNDFKVTTNPYQMVLGLLSALFILANIFFDLGSLLGGIGALRLLAFAGLVILFLLPALPFHHLIRYKRARRALGVIQGVTNLLRFVAILLVLLSVVMLVLHLYKLTPNQLKLEALAIALVLATLILILVLGSILYKYLPSVSRQQSVQEDHARRFRIASTLWMLLFFIAAIPYVMFGDFVPDTFTIVVLAIVAWWLLQRVNGFLKGLNSRIHNILEPSPFDALVTMINDMETQAANSVQIDYPAEFVHSVTKLNEAFADDAPEKIILVHTLEGAHCLHGNNTREILTEAHRRTEEEETPDDATEFLVGEWLKPEEIQDIRQEILENLCGLYNRGVACIGLAHWYPNVISNTAFSYPARQLDLVDPQRWPWMTRDVTIGLSEIGEDVVRAMLLLGIIIDVTHTSPAARRDIYHLIDDEFPGRRSAVLASHVGAYSLNPLAYNLTDAEILWMAQHEGVIGVMFSGFYLAGRERVKLGLRYITQTVEYLVNLVNRHAKKNNWTYNSQSTMTGPIQGIDIVGFGSDFDGFSEPPDDIANAEHWPRVTQRLRGLYEDFATGQPRFTDQEVQQMLGKNTLRVLQTGWKRVDETTECTIDQLEDALEAHKNNL